MAKGAIAHYEQFLFLPQCIHQSSAAELSVTVGYTCMLVKGLTKIPKYFHCDLVKVWKVIRSQLARSWKISSPGYKTYSCSQISVQLFPLYRRFLMTLRQTTFWKHCDKKEKLLMMSNFTILPQYFQLLASIMFFVWRDIPIFSLNKFKAVCCRFVVCG